MPVARQHVAGHRDRQADGEFGGGDRQQIGDDGHPDAAPRTGVGIEIVEPFERAGDDPQVRAARQEVIVDRIGHEGHQRGRVFCLRLQMVAAPRLGGFVGNDIAMRPQQLQRLGIGFIRDDYFCH